MTEEKQISNKEVKKRLPKIAWVVIGLFVFVMMLVLLGGKEKEIEPITEKQETKTEEAVEEKITDTKSEPKTETNRNEIIEIFKKNALAKWGDDYRMVQYEIEKQTEAYDWIIRYVKYDDILAKAKQKWGDDYGMVKYEYEKQAESYEWINKQTAYPEIMESAKQRWGDDYGMVKYEYEKQVKAYENL